MDTQGYIKVRAGTPETNVEGVFAAGDVQDTEWRQVRVRNAQHQKTALTMQSNKSNQSSECYICRNLYVCVCVRVSPLGSSPCRPCDFPFGGIFAYNIRPPTS